jgi:hypothetical protein
MIIMMPAIIAQRISAVDHTPLPMLQEIQATLQVNMETQSATRL